VHEEVFWGYSKYHSVIITEMLLDPGLPSFDTVMHHNRIFFFCYVEEYYTDSVYVDLGIHHFSFIEENGSCIAFQTLGLRLRLGKMLGFMSGLTLSATVARGRHRNSTPNHAGRPKISLVSTAACKVTPSVYVYAECGVATIVLLSSL